MTGRKLSDTNVSTSVARVRRGVAADRNMQYGHHQNEQHVSSYLHVYLCVFRGH